MKSLKAIKRLLVIVIVFGFLPQLGGTAIIFLFFEALFGEAFDLSAELSSKVTEASKRFKKNA